jgi:hypothetical protein
MRLSIKSWLKVSRKQDFPDLKQSMIVLYSNYQIEFFVKIGNWNKKKSNQLLVSIPLAL